MIDPPALIRDVFLARHQCLLKRLLHCVGPKNLCLRTFNAMRRVKKWIFCCPSVRLLSTLITCSVEIRRHGSAWIEEMEMANEFSGSEWGRIAKRHVQSWSAS